MSEFKVALAPLAGFSDRAFRTCCKEFGADLLTSEMVSSRGIFYKDKKTATLMSFDKTEQPLYIQLFGCEPEIMAYAAKEVEKLAPAGIDINMGCPMPKIVNNGDGSALMRKPDLAFDVIKSVVSSVSLPVSVKFRSGYDAEHINAVEFGQLCEEAGATSITVHGRTREQLYSGKADWDIIKRVKAAVGIYVYGNGDIFTPEDAKRMVDETGVDGVAIGRGAQGNPFIFSQIKEYFSTGKYSVPEKKEKISTALKQVKRMCDFKGEKVAIPEARKHLAFYLKGLYGAARYKNKIFSAKSFEEIERLLKEFMNV